MNKRMILLGALALCLIGFLLYWGIQRVNTVTLAGSQDLKTEQIQPLFGSVTVSGDRDTDVVFTDVDSGETFVIGYITPGMSEDIRLRTGSWYSVKGAGRLTLGPVHVRVQE